MLEQCKVKYISWRRQKRKWMLTLIKIDSSNNIKIGSLYIIWSHWYVFWQFCDISQHLSQMASFSFQNATEKLSTIFFSIVFFLLTFSWLTAVSQSRNPTSHFWYLFEKIEAICWYIIGALQITGLFGSGPLCREQQQGLVAIKIHLFFSLTKFRY